MQIFGASNKISKAREFLVKSRFRLSIFSLGSPLQRSSNGCSFPSLMIGLISHRTAHHISWLQQHNAASTLSRKPLIHIPGIFAAIAGSGTIPLSRPGTVFAHSRPSVLLISRCMRRYLWIEVNSQAGIYYPGQGCFTYAYNRLGNVGKTLGPILTACQLQFRRLHGYDDMESPLLRKINATIRTTLAF